jgi:hypothetical protein
VSRPLAPMPPISVIRAGPQFEDFQEERFFRAYLDIAAHIRSPFPTLLWDKLTPQSSEAEPYIRHALVAIGAMSQTQKDMRLKREVSRSPQSLENSWYIFALKQYDKVLVEIQKNINDGKGVITNAFLAYLFIYFLQNILERPDAAAANAIGGLMVIIERTLTSMDRCKSKSMKNQCLGQSIDEDIATAIIGLDLQVVFFFDKRPAPVYQVYITAFNSVIARISEELPSLKAAKHFLVCDHE